MAERDLTVYIDDLEISNKGKRVLLIMKIGSLNELVKRSVEEISAFPGIEEDTVRELQYAIEHAGDIFAWFEKRKRRIDEIYEDVKEYDISAMPFSSIVRKSLAHAGIRNVGDMISMTQKDVMALRNIGPKSRADITSAINTIINEGGNYFSPSYMPIISGESMKVPQAEERDERISALSDEVKRIPVDRVSISTRASNCLREAKISTVDELVRMTESDIAGMRNAGERTTDEILAVIEGILSQGSSYTGFIKEEQTEPAVEQKGKGFDYSVIEELIGNFYLKPSRMTEWFGMSRQGVSNIIEKKLTKRQKSWTGKDLSDSEGEILAGMIDGKTFEYKDDLLECCCLNDGKGNFACLFIYDEDIKCFFLKDLPEELQQRIADSGMNLYTERELAGESEGEIKYSLRKPYFYPKNPDKFRRNALFRRMTLDEYARFLSGSPLGDARQVQDERIISFLEENLVDGKVYLSSDPKNQWIRSIASRNGYLINDFIKLYGYEPIQGGYVRTADETRERHIDELKRYIVGDNIVYFPTDSRISHVLRSYSYTKGMTLNEYIKTLGFERTTERPAAVADILEKDMEERRIEGGFEEKLFARYPLIGSRLLKPDILERLNNNARHYIDNVLRIPSTKLPLRAEMQITIALINHAKNWTYEENSNFWKYISLQFGYRDGGEIVVRLLQTSLENAMKRNNRLFIEDSNGRAFKSTVVIHALSTRKSWIALFDFLFDFYKNNLNWKCIPGDPLIEVMVRALQQKLAGEGSDDLELTISSKVYSFQEGIRKLIVYRPVFTRRLFEKLISRINDMLNAEAKPARTYEELLCEEWFREKITAIASTKRAERQGQGTQRDVAIDYSRIHVKYILKNETDIQVVLPDIRLKSEEVSRAVLAIYYNEAIVRQQNMSWYGNELGKTLNGMSLSLPAISEGDGAIDIRVRITCDNEEIYDSDVTLNRRLWVFYGGNECNTGQIRKDNYTIVLPRSSVLETENTMITEIDSFKNPGLKAYFLELHEGYVIASDGHLIAFDSENGNDIRVIAPSESARLPRVETDDQDHYFAYRSSICNIILGSLDQLQKFVILRDGERVELSSLSSSDNGLAFAFPLSGEKDTCRLQVINLADERLVFDRSFILIDHAVCGFARKYYYSAADYRDGVYRAEIDDFSDEMSFEPNDEEARIPYRDGEIVAVIPKVTVEETSGAWMDGSAPAWYIGDIPQTSLLRVSAPSGLDVRFMVGGKDIQYDGQGIVTLGNALQSFCDTENFSMADVQMKVNDGSQERSYTLARVCFRERFLGRPEFWTEGQRLYWNQGGMFIGKAGRTFTLSLFGDTETPIEFKLDENTEYVDIPEDMAIGNYRYQISIVSGSLFKKVREIIAEGDCVVGDKNMLRFQDRKIVIDSITDEFNEGAGHIPISTCMVDNIEFKGVEDTSEGYCPVYSGILHATGYHGERYEFSFDRHTNNRGVTKMMVNPVRIVFISDSALCITDPEGDGLYYYHYFDRVLQKKIFALTDHEYTQRNKDRYANADLYSYHTERI